ncbi:hypothetical protein SAMN05192574_102397 [Mucilaginibacter gossypiicola]|uniref:4-amino-4-deoxy-L-arabinose transferase n=1 Tax=Mucilaginibacter gossypiicola TaxID=551995 RepID=A0A1H8DLR7_9SPHI|nr:hypothetical protein [Mucilaginibacter gossypiicola]SEN08220.1 hypothetical protein SAMN05192574_102397 [Mucilaginibacter gossypiicola]
MQLKENAKYIFAGIILLTIAFIQCYKTIHDLHWAFEPDFDRDIGYISNTLDGRFGSDPNIAGQYMWYNPLLYLSETAIVYITGLPVNIVVARAGAFLNLLGPVFFFFMMVKLFDYKIALAALASFLFLATGDLPGWGGATYSPWPLADSYVQFIFYLNIFLCYKAFSTQKMTWFILLGIFLGVSFLGHSAPTIIVILILMWLQGQKILIAVKERKVTAIKTYFLQGFFTVVPFVIFSFPFLYFVLVKYHLHFVNRTILQCAPGVFARKDTLELLKLNVTFPLIIALIGFVWFYRNYKNPIIRKIIFSWFCITLLMYCYEAVLPAANRILHIALPDTIPAFHYFFYFKAAQSVFFGFGFIALFSAAIKWLSGHISKRTGIKAPLSFPDNLIVAGILLFALAYYPVYSTRKDFVEPRQQALVKERQTDKIAVYNYISKNIPLDKVMLCGHDQSLFPVMATGVKMVSIEIYFSNPYISFEKREDDRNAMLSYLTTAQPKSAENLFAAYHVDYVLLTNEHYKNYKSPASISSSVVFKNNSFTLIALRNSI